MNNLKKYRGFMVAFVLLAVVVGIAWQPLQLRIEKKQKQYLQSQLKMAILSIPELEQLPTFSLRDGDNAIFDNQRLIGKWSLLFFGYTHCPDVCPTELFGLNRLLEIMQEKSLTMPQVLFISLDSHRDTPAVMKKYTEYFNPDFIGVSGEQTAIDELARHFKVSHESVYYQGEQLIRLKKGDKKPDDYIVNHSAWLYLINPQGKLHALLPSPHDNDLMLHELQLLMN